MTKDNSGTNREEAITRLFFRNSDGIEISDAAVRARETCDRLQVGVQGVRILSGDSAYVSTLNHNIGLALSHGESEDLPGFEAELTLSFSRHTEPTEKHAHSDEALMAHVTRDQQSALGADFVMWMQTSDLIDGVEFMTKTTPLERVRTRQNERRSAPKPKVHSRHVRPAALPAAAAPVLQAEAPAARATSDVVAWADASPDQEALRTSLRLEMQAMEEAAQPVEEVRGSALERMSAWLFSYTVAMFCLPVGCMLFVLNLLRGENLRLSSQSAALAGTFVTLQVSGSMAQAAQTMQVLLP